MSKSTTAVLISALVLPGAGHFYLKKPVVGSVLMGITFVCLYFIFSTIFTVSRTLAVSIQGGDIPFDIGKITELASHELSGGNDRVIIIATFSLIICWLIAIADAFRIGKLQGKNDAAKGR